MTPQRLIDVALAAGGVDSAIAAVRNLSGGCIHRVFEITLTSGQVVVIKTNNARFKSVFEEEAHGLRAMANTKTVCVPQPLAVVEADGQAALLLTAIRSVQATNDAWRRLGEELASLHRQDIGARYGFETDNHLGATVQLNRWCDDWVEFNASQRLGHQLRLSVNAGLVHSDERRRIELVIARLGDFIAYHPKPSLLHGDLWSGNALATRDENGHDRIAVIDPACSIGDGWADIAMMRLFGGFPEACFDAYAASIGDHENRGDRGDIEARIAVYQLYHVLNHVNLFGRGYIGQALSLIEQLGC